LTFNFEWSTLAQLIAPHGRLNMKILRFLCLSMLVVGFAVAASAQTPVDPTIITQKLDPSCSDPGVICYTGAAPLSITFSPTLAVVFVYQPPNPASLLTDFKLDLTSVPPFTSFGCQTDIWVNCSITDEGSGTFQFDMSGGYNPGHPPTNCNYNDGVGGVCPGFLASGDGASITAVPLVSETPEPVSVILFGTGLLSIFGASKRRLYGRS
jgi:hypothetical protein